LSLGNGRTSKTLWNDTRYGGAAMMLASNFRFATEDVDIAAIGMPWPAWLTDAVQTIAVREGRAEDWLNEAVTFHLPAGQ